MQQVFLFNLQNKDDPLKVHKTISPKCHYIVGMSASTSQYAFNDEEHAYKTAVNSNYVAMSKRYASFDNWSNQNMPKIDDLVKAGFFFAEAGGQGLALIPLIERM